MLQNSFEIFGIRHRRAGPAASSAGLCQPARIESSRDIFPVKEKDPKTNPGFRVFFA
jgi:hypothetical protein